MLGPEGRRQHSSASQVVGRAAAGPGMGPAPAVSPHPRSRAARGAPFAAQPEDSCAHPAAAPALRLHPDAALAALLGEGRHAALLLSVAWVAAYGFAARVRTTAACRSAAHDASPRYAAGHASRGAVAAVRSNLRGGLALFGAPHSRFLSPAPFQRIVRIPRAMTAVCRAFLRAHAALTPRPHHPPRSWSSRCLRTSGRIAWRRWPSL